MLQKKDPSILNLALLVALATSSQTIAAFTPTSLAQAASSSSLTGSLSQTVALGITASPLMAASTSTLTSASNETVEDASAAKTTIPTWVWWLLPLGLLGLFIWWLSSKRSSDTEPTPPDQTALPNLDSAASDATELPLDTIDPASEAGSVISSDRAAIADIPSPSLEQPETSGVDTTSEPTTDVGSSNGLQAAIADSSTPKTVSSEPAMSGASTDSETLSAALAADAPTIQAAGSGQTTPPTATTEAENLTLADQSSAAEPLATFDAIEELTQLEALVDNADAIEGSDLVLNQVPTILDLTEGATSGASLGLPGMATTPFPESLSEAVEATQSDVKQPTLSREALATIDQGLAGLPDGYGESRIVLLPRDPQWAYAYWDVPIEQKMKLRQQGGQNLVLRLYDVTDVDLARQSPHNLQQFDCDELAREWYVSIPVSDRDYLVEIGYLTTDGHWLMLARSSTIRIPPVYPSDWFDNQFVTIDWEEDLRGKTFLELLPPETQTTAVENNPIYERVFGLAQGAEAQRVAGSLFGSMQQVPQQAISSFVFPSEMGAWAFTPSGMSGVGMGMSGVGMSGVGFGASISPVRPRNFWLVADAELIVYGATEPDAKVTIDGQPIQLNPDGTFRFQMSFQDGLINYPIFAVAADNEQTRSIHLQFNRETPHRNTNTKNEATDEWL